MFIFFFSPLSLKSQTYLFATAVFLNHFPVHNKSFSVDVPRVFLLPRLLFVFFSTDVRPLTAPSKTFLYKRNTSVENGQISAQNTTGFKKKKKPKIFFDFSLILIYRRKRLPFRWGTNFRCMYLSVTIKVILLLRDVRSGLSVSMRWVHGAVRVIDGFRLMWGLIRLRVWN